MTGGSPFISATQLEMTLPQDDGLIPLLEEAAVLRLPRRIAEFYDGRGSGSRFNRRLVLEPDPAESIGSWS